MLDSGRNFASTTIRDASIDRRYEILRRINNGGMATVYLGRLRGVHGFSRLVALKAMHAHYATDAKFAAMFVDEARVTALLRHPNIVSTLDVISTNGSLLLVMEYIEGESLAGLAAAAQDESLPISIGCAIVHDMLLGLHHAHEAKDDEGRPLGIIHRDVSPQNVIVGLDGLARVLDFGIAKARNSCTASETGTIRGKIPYMAPEQLGGRAIDRRADVYGAGVVLWETLTGRRLFQGDNIALMSRILTESVPAPSSINPAISPDLDALVARALARDPKDRFTTAEEMAEALERCVRIATRAEIAQWVGAASTPKARAPFTSDVAFVLPASEAPPLRTRSERRSSRFETLLIGLGLLFIGAVGVTIGSAKPHAFVRQAFAQQTATNQAAPPSPAPSAVVVMNADANTNGANVVSANATPVGKAEKAEKARRASPPRPNIGTTKKKQKNFDADLGF